MKKATLLNGPISSVVSRMGHGDSICIGDAGLPIPDNVERIDLAVSRGVPSFLAVVEAVTAELCVERAVVAHEFSSDKSELRTKLSQNFIALEQSQGNTISVDEKSHEQFKKLTEECKAVIRTGECTPYANIIIYAGVTF